jgi:hypothetical protein
MRGEPQDDPGDAAGREPAAVLAARIQRQLDELYEARAPRLAQGCVRLQSGVFGWDTTAVVQTVSALHSAGRQLHFLPLRQSWIARLLGRHRAAHARFIATCERIIACAGPAKAQVLALAGGEQDHTAAARQALLEFDLEQQRLNAAIDQGVTWLQDMCTQLAGARGRGSDDRELESLAEAAQRFTQEFKRLQSMGAMAQDIAMRGNTVLQRRAALLAQLRLGMERMDNGWVDRVGDLVKQLKAGRSATRAIPKAIEAHDEMMKRLAAAIDACGALQHEEHLLARHLGLLHEKLQRPRHGEPDA